MTELMLSDRGENFLLYVFQNFFYPSVYFSGFRFSLQKTMKSTHSAGSLCLTRQRWGTLWLSPKDIGHFGYAAVFVWNHKQGEFSSCTIHMIHYELSNFHYNFMLTLV